MCLADEIITGNEEETLQVQAKAIQLLYTTIIPRKQLWN
jgi:hypothetical protein